MPDTGNAMFMDYGTATSISASVAGLQTADFPNDSGLMHLEYVGADDEVVGGPYDPQGSASGVVKESTLMAYALRSGYTSPSLTDLCIAGGYQGAGRKYTGVKLNTLTIKGAVNQALTWDLTWCGLTDASYTTAAQTLSTKYAYMFHTATASITGFSLQVQSWTVTINNNITFVRHGDTATENQMRWPDALNVGKQVITFTCEVLVRPNATEYTDFIGDTLATDGAATLTAVGGTSGTQTLTLTLANLSRKTRPQKVQVGGDVVVYSCAYDSKNNAASLTITEA